MNASEIAAWVSAIAAVVIAIVNVINARKASGSKPVSKQHRSLPKALWGIVVMLAVVSLGLFVNINMPRPHTSATTIANVPTDSLRHVLVNREADSLISIRQGQPLNMQLTAAAWDAYSNRRYEVAICLADRCINEFQIAANIEQSQLEVTGNPLPPIGRVSDTERNTIIAQGMLNDLATCLWIKARSAQSLGRLDQAAQAYQATARYTYARTWDPNGWFWSPSEDALKRLATMR